MRKATAVALLSLALSCAAFAQSVAGLGAISGTVHDASGAAVPDAQVVVSNESKGIKRTLNTTEAGLFTAPSLVPATGYTVTIGKTGFATYEVKDFQVLVGQNLSLDVVLTVAGTATQIQVEATAPLVDSTKTDVSQVIGSGQILDLPINGRRVDSFVLLSPSVVPDGTFGLVSFRGIAGGNSFLTDGNDTTEQYYNENAGRTRITSQISQDAVQEFQVVSNNYSAEFGHATGGVVNTVTRSGSNDFHGTGYWFFRNQDFNAKDTFATINPEEKRNQLGASAGGKIVKDKLFYFANYEAMRRNFPLIASITAAGSSLFDTNGNFIATCTASAAQCETARRFLDRQFQTLDRTATQDLGFGKLDWRPTERNSFSASLNVLRWVSPNGLQTQAVLNNGNGVGNNVNSSVRSKYGRFTWTAIPSNTMVNEFRFGWFKDKQFDYPNDQLAIPGIGFLGINVTGQSLLGTATDYPRTNPSENRFSYADTLTWTKGRHTLKLGGEVIRTEDYTNLLFNRTGTYTFPSWTALASDFSGNSVGNKDWSTFTQTIGNPEVDLYLTDYSVFLQDQYKASTRLTLNLGVRYDYTSLPQPTLTNPDYPATGRIPTYNKEFAPRIGFAYTLGRNDRTVVRGGYGIFNGRYPGGLINTFFLGNGLYQKAISLNSSNASDKANGPVFPNVLPNSGNFNPPAGSVSLNIASKDFRTPYTQQADLAIEHQLTNDLSFTASYIWSRGLHLTSVNDINIGPPAGSLTYRINDAGGNQTGSYTTPIYVRQNRVDPRYARINVVDAGLNSWYNGLALQLNKRMSQSFTGSVSYTWSHAIDEGQGGAGTPNIFASGGPQTYIPGDYRGEKGTSTLDVRQRLGLSAVWAPKFIHNGNAAARYLIDNWQLALLAFVNSSPHATPTVQVSTTPAPTGFTSANNGTLNGYTSGGLGGRVPFLPINSLDVGEQSKLDARISKIFPIKERAKAMFTFDAFNIFNHRFFTSVNTREYVYSSVAGVPTLTYQSNVGQGTASQGFPDGTNARRLQIGLRLIW
ncbi:MAG: carboxypeptidase regulatory-like domain-containing protein [Acidobacteriia bacterium]|nr:carboxypeptidase regulatory-like domain-containing protein [Terriglobia bacterium]